MDVRGTVKDAREEKGIPGARVSLYIGDRELAVLSSDDIGAFSYKEHASYAGETLIIKVKKAGYQDRQVTHDIEHDEVRLEIELLPAHEGQPGGARTKGTPTRVALIGAGAAIIAALIMAVFARHGGDDKAHLPMPVASIEIVPAGGSIEVGGTIQLRANVKGSQGSRLHGRAITWASSDNAVAAVSSGGLVSGLKAGTSTVTAASEGVTQTATISVRSTPSLVSWSDCRWIEVGAQKSHQPGEKWLPDGYFITQIDLDGPRECSAHDSPVIGRVRCCKVAGYETGNCRWIEVGAQKSHQKGENWLPDGYFITQIDLDGCGACGAHDSPVIGRVGICEMLGCRWSDCRWVEVGAQKSHHGGGNWLPDGYFITQLDLDGPKEYDAHDSPIIGRVRICKPKPRE